MEDELVDDVLVLHSRESVLLGYQHLMELTYRHVSLALHAYSLLERSVMVEMMRSVFASRMRF